MKFIKDFKSGEQLYFGADFPELFLADKLVKRAKEIERNDYQDYVCGKFTLITWITFLKNDSSSKAQSFIEQLAKTETVLQYRARVTSAYELVKDNLEKKADEKDNKIHLAVDNYWQHVASLRGSTDKKESVIKLSSKQEILTELKNSEQTNDTSKKR